MCIPILCVQYQRIGFFIETSMLKLIHIARTLKVKNSMDNCDIMINIKRESLMGKSKFIRKTLGLIAAMGFCVLMAVPAYGATYYVRSDGGSATQCSGLSDVPYPGSGANVSCAFNHPFWALATRNNPTKLEGGDTLIIDGSDNAEYMIGWGAPNITSFSNCHSSYPWDCYFRPVPSGPDPAHPTRILGKGWDSGCNEPPQLWATERVLPRWVAVKGWALITVDSPVVE